MRTRNADSCTATSAAVTSSSFLYWCGLQARKSSAVVWVGILSDWEMSKPVAESLDKERARQPERNGKQYLGLRLSDGS